MRETDSTTRFLLVRHGSTDALGLRVAGRLPGMHLNDQGRLEVERLCVRLRGIRISAVYSSPLERTRETAEALCRDRSSAVRILDALNEIDFGRWSGLNFDDLHRNPEWRLFNAYRTGARPPGGELAVEVVSRMVAAIERLREVHPAETIAVVGHGDPLKALIGHYAGIPLELLHRVALDPASVSVLELSPAAARIVRLNDTGDLPEG